MTVSVSGSLAEVDYTATSQFTMFDFQSRQGQRAGLIVFAHATTNGVLQVYYKDQNGNERALLGGQANLNANVMDVLKIDHPVPRAVVKFTPASQPGTIIAEAMNYG